MCKLLCFREGKLTMELENDVFFSEEKVQNPVGGFNPSEKYDRQNENLPQVGVKI